MKGFYMTKKLLALALALSASTAHIYSDLCMKDFKTTEKITAAIQAADAGLSLFLAEEAKGISDVVNAAGVINLICANVEPGSSSSILPLVRIIKKSSENAPWLWKSSKLKDSATALEVTTNIIHGITAEVVRYYAHYGIKIGMDHLTDNEIASRVAHTLGEALSSGAIETLFEHINRKLEAKTNDKGTESIINDFGSKFIDSLIPGIAYNLAGFLIKEHMASSQPKQEGYLKAIIGN